jgi:hypothetical protein
MAESLPILSLKMEKPWLSGKTMIYRSEMVSSDESFKTKNGK